MDFLSTDMTRGKLLVLYFIRKTEGILPEAQVIRAILNEDWLDYFSLCQALGELQDAHLIGTNQSSSGEPLIITPKGEDVLQAFVQRLPDSIREQIDVYATENRKQMMRETQYLATYEWVGNDAFMISLQIIERGNVIYDTKLRVRTREDALLLCERWKAKADAVYRTTVSILTSDYS